MGLAMEPHCLTPPPTLLPALMVAIRRHRRRQHRLPLVPPMETICTAPMAVAVIPILRRPMVV